MFTGNVHNAQTYDNKKHVEMSLLYVKVIVNNNKYKYKLSHTEIVWMS